jgi:hypothetical protein
MSLTLDKHWSVEHRMLQRAISEELKEAHRWRRCCPDIASVGELYERWWD